LQDTAARSTDVVRYRPALVSAFGGFIVRFCCEVQALTEWLAVSPAPRAQASCRVRPSPDADAARHCGSADEAKLVMLPLHWVWSRQEASAVYRVPSAPT
jgi:hypothetical protein